MAFNDFRRNLNKEISDLKRKFVEWSYGRNGADELSSACTNVGIVLVILNLFIKLNWLSIVALLLFAYAWFRISSKDITARSKENAQAMKAAGPVIAFLAHPTKTAEEHKNYVHIACPSCGQKVRIPRGKGKVRITCPKCHTRFDGKA